MPASPVRKPYGLWQSPITAAPQPGRASEDLAWDSDGQTLVWVEGRSDWNVLVAQTGTDARRD